MMVWLSGQVFQMGQMPQPRKIINSSTTPLNQAGVRLVSVFLVVRVMKSQETSSRTSLLEQVFVWTQSLQVTILTSMILELRFMTIPFYVQGQLMTSITSIVVRLISNKFVEQSRMSMSTIINYWIPWLIQWLLKTLRWVTMVMEKSVYQIIRLTIRRRLLELFQQFLQQSLSQSQSII